MSLFLQQQALYIQKLKIHYHPDVESIENKSIFTRLATRSIAIERNSIYLPCTELYKHYSLPDSGLGSGEDIIEEMTRELTEYTGAKDICNIKSFVIYEE